MRYAIKTRINHGTKMSLYEYLYGVKPSGGLATLPTDGKLLTSLSKEEDLTRQWRYHNNNCNQEKSKTANVPVLQMYVVRNFIYLNF